MAIHIPPYIHRNFQNDLPHYKDQACRIASATLPFLTLYRPCAYPLSLAMGGLRVITALRENKDSFRALHVTAAVAAVAGTLFGHPLGMLIATAHDLFLDLHGVIKGLQDGDYRQSMTGLLQALNNTLYLGLFMGGGAPLLAASLSLQFLSGINRSYAHFQKGGERLEGTSQLLMALIRGHQAIRSWQSIAAQKEFQKAKEENKPYLPLANRVQKFFVNTGYRLNTLARWSFRQISRLTYSQEVFPRGQTAIKVAFGLPFALAGLLLSAPCYFAASYAGIGRFEKIEAQTTSTPTSGKIDVLFQNICGQDPWSSLSGGQIPPLEAGRADAILENILKNNPDVYCGQEYDDLATSEKIATELAKHGYTSVRDLGCTDPIFNHSGLFMAVKSSADTIGFHPFKSEHTSGITKWCRRGVFEVTVDSLKILNIHLNSGSSLQDQAARLNQLGHYVAPFMNGPALAIGDSNLDTSLLTQDEKKQAGIADLTNALEGQVTCSDEGKHILNGKERNGCTDCAEKIDVALYDANKVAISNIQITPGNSDHYAISFTAAVK